MSDRIREALHCIPADDRDMWLRMGMAVKSELGEEGFAPWDEWSQSASNYNEREARAVWKSITPDGGITIGTLFHEAQKNGWRDDGTHQKPTPEEIAERKRKAAERAAKEKAEEAARHKEAQAEAARIWKDARPVKEHPYLASKGITGAYGAKEYNGALVLPVRDKGGAPHSLQFIDEKGEKRFLTGGRKRGCYFAIGKPDGVLCIAEGFATAASIHEATGCAVAVAFDAGNLQPVAKALREKFPGLRLVLCADDDYRTEGNPGITKATEAARAVGGLLAVPDFGANRPEKATDFNDLHQHAGKEAVKRCIEAAKQVQAEDKQETGKQSAPAGEYAREVILTRASEVKMEPVRWLWPGWLAAGKLHILAGAPGTGKTTIAMRLAATVTTGGQWPDGSRLSFAGDVAIWSGEDDPADTLIPRLALSGADRSRVHFINGIQAGGGREPFDPARDIEPLRRKLAQVGNVRLLIIDPIVSAVAGDSHKNAEVRRGLQALVDLAGEMGCALLGITHFSKGTGGRDPVERLTGSLAFGALARVVMIAAKHQEEGEDGRSTRIFCRAKSNIGRDDGGFEYDLMQGEVPEHPGVFASCVQWGQPVEGAARELLATAEASGDDGEGGSLADAKRFLADLLADGALSAKTIKAEADGAGYSWATIRRAKTALGIEAVKEGGRFGETRQKWVWRLSAAEDAQGEHLLTHSQKMLKNSEDAQQNSVSTFCKIEHLQGNSDWVEVEI